MHTVHICIMHIHDPVSMDVLMHFTRLSCDVPSQADGGLYPFFSHCQLTCSHDRSLLSLDSFVVIPKKIEKSFPTKLI